MYACEYIQYVCVVAGEQEWGACYTFGVITSVMSFHCASGGRGLCNKEERMHVVGMAAHMGR